MCGDIYDSVWNQRTFLGVIDYSVIIQNSKYNLISQLCIYIDLNQLVIVRHILELYTRIIIVTIVEYVWNEIRAMVRYKWEN